MSLPAIVIAADEIADAITAGSWSSPVVAARTWSPGTDTPGAAGGPLLVEVCPINDDLELASSVDEEISGGVALIFTKRVASKNDTAAIDAIVEVIESIRTSLVGHTYGGLSVVGSERTPVIGYESLRSKGVVITVCNLTLEGVGVVP